MPTDLESIAIYLIVLLTLGWLVRGFLIKGKKNRSCGHSCCDIATPRHPVIQKILDRDRRP